MKRTLTVSFTRAVGSVIRDPVEVEVVLRAVGSRTSGQSDLTYLPTPDRRIVRLNKPVVQVLFELTPSNDPSFKEPLLYRISWRRGYLGKLESYDFYMPNQDATFEDVIDLGGVPGEEPLTESDLGVAGRVAQLSSSGHVLDGSKNPLYSSAEIDDLLLAVQELGQREDQGVIEHVDQSILGLQASLDSSIRRQVQEAEERLQSEVDLQGETQTEALNTLRSEIQTQIENLSIGVPEDLQTLLDSKADLQEGKIKLEQIPGDLLGGSLHSVNTADNLTLLVARKGDIAVTPTDAWFLTGSSAVRSDWVRLSTLLPGVQSVNGKSGSSVYLTPTDVGARPSGPVPLAEVSGLQEKLDQELDGVLREDVDGKLPTIHLRDDVPRLDGTRIINSLGEEIAVAGNVTSVNGLEGDVFITAESLGARRVDIPLTVSEVTGLQSTLNLKVGVSDPRLTDSRTPLSHASTHLATGSDPLTLAQSQVTNLVTDLGGKATKSELDALRQFVEEGMPENPEQQANAAKEFAALSLTAAENATTESQKTSTYLDDVNTKYTVFQSEYTEFGTKYTEFTQDKATLSNAVESLTSIQTDIDTKHDGVVATSVEVANNKQLAEEAAALAVLAAELITGTTPSV